MLENVSVNYLLLVRCLLRLVSRLVKMQALLGCVERALLARDIALGRGDQVYIMDG